MTSLIMIHGFGASADQWKYLRHSLSKYGLDPTVVELIGHGNGDKPRDPEQYSVDHIYRKLVCDIDSIANHRVTMIGHSLGGYLTLRFAHEFPDRVEKMVLISPLFTGEQMYLYLRLMNFAGKSLFGRRERFPSYLNRIGYRLSKVTHPFFDDEVRKTLFEDFAKLTPRVLNTPGSFGDLSSILPEVHQPALLIWGDKDRTLNPELYPHFADLLKPKKIKIFEGEDHGPHMTCPDEVGESIIDFLNGSDN